MLLTGDSLEKLGRDTPPSSPIARDGSGAVADLGWAGEVGPARREQCSTAATASMRAIASGGMSTVYRGLDSGSTGRSR